MLIIRVFRYKKQKIVKSKIKYRIIGLAKITKYIIKRKIITLIELKIKRIID